MYIFINVENIHIQGFLHLARGIKRAHDFLDIQIFIIYAIQHIINDISLLFNVNIQFECIFISKC